MDKIEDKQNIDIELSDEIAQGVFSNMALVNFSSTEFILDFIQIMPGIPKAKVRSRVILTPEHAKRLLELLSTNISRYDEQSENNYSLNIEPKGQA